MPPSGAGETSDLDDGLAYDLDDGIGGGDPNAAFELFAHLSEDDHRAPRGLPPLPEQLLKMATTGASRPMKPGLIAEGARPPVTPKHGGSKFVQSVMDVLTTIDGGGIANAPGDEEEARNAPKSLTDTEHLLSLLTLGGAAVAGGAVAGGLTRAGASNVLANAAGGAAAGGVMRAGTDIVEGSASSPGTYLRDMLIGAAAGGALSPAEKRPPISKVAPQEPADVGLSDRGYRPRPGERSTTRAQHKSQRGEARVAKADQPLDPAPGSNKARRGHGHADHGHQTTAAQQKNRIRTGITPGGRPAPPPSEASSFGSPAAEAEALARGRKQLDRALKNGTARPFTKKGKPARFEADVETNRKEGFGRREVAEVGPDGEPLLDADGKQVPRSDPTPLRRARVVFEYVPSANEWRPLTYYPKE